VGLRALGVLALCAAAAAETGEELYYRGLHAEKVQGDRRAAKALYARALEDRGLAPARQAELHLRLAICLEALEAPGDALGHLGEAIYAAPGVPDATRRRADAVRNRILARRERAAPAPPPAPPPADEAAAARARKAEEYLAEARRLRGEGDETGALLRVEMALFFDPSHADARALRQDLEARLSEATTFVRDALEVLRTWTEARTRVVLAQAQELLRRGDAHAARDELAPAEARYREAIERIDASGFAAESDELAQLRLVVRERWRALRAEHYGRANVEPPVGDAPRRDTLRAEFLNHLQRMLNLVSTGDREYRILPVPAARPPPAKRWYRKPARFQLLQDLPSSWSSAEFARHLLAARVEPATWNEPGNFLESAGAMLVARNRTRALDALERALAPVRAPERRALRVRFVLASAPAAAVDRLQAAHGRFELSALGPSPVLHRVIPPDFDFERIVNQLRDHGVEVRLDDDVFSAELDNGAPRTLFVTAPLSAARGYEDPDLLRLPAAHVAASYGFLLDAYPLREAGGRTALALRLASRFPAAPVRLHFDGRPGVHPRFLSQQAELFVDMPAGATLVVAGLVDPFASARAETEPGSGYLLLLENPAEPGAAPEGGRREAPEGGGGGTIFVPLPDLLLRVHDDPGPHRSDDAGFVARDPTEVVGRRARFLEALLRSELSSDAVFVRVETAALEAPDALREAAAEAVERLREESARTYVVRVRALAVRTNVLERWMTRERLDFRRFGEHAAVAVTTPLVGEFVAAEPADVFAPAGEVAAFGALGLQARHALSTRARTFAAAPADGADLATAVAKGITEGIRVSVRPFRRGGSLRAEVEVETAAIESQSEERSTPGGLPAYRTRVGGSLASGEIDLGAPEEARTAVIARLPHPTASTPDHPTELLILLDLRPAAR
jgi:hypothetical protein